MTIRVEPTTLHIFDRGRFLKTVARKRTEEITRPTEHKKNRSHTGKWSGSKAKPPVSNSDS